MTSGERILITGAAGEIGTMLRTRLSRPGRTLRLLDIKALDVQSPNEEVLRASVTDLRRMERACKGADAVIHLGGCSGESSWDTIMNVNINGTRVTFEAARRQGVKRFVYASSNHAVGFFPRDRAPAGDYLFPMPDTYYGVSKVAGEAIGSLYHSRYGLDVICLRIMSCTDTPRSLRALSTWLSPDDAGRLFEACLTVRHPGFRVAWGVSANTRGWCSLAEAEALGYSPQDNAEAFAEGLIESLGSSEATGIEDSFLGGSYCSDELGVENVDASSRRKPMLRRFTSLALQRVLRKQTSKWIRFGNCRFAVGTLVAVGRTLSYSNLADSGERLNGLYYSAIRERVLVEAFIDAGLDKDEARVLARIGLTILVGSQQIEDRVDRQRLDDLLSEYQRWLGVRREGPGLTINRIPLTAPHGKD